MDPTKHWKHPSNREESLRRWVASIPKINVEFLDHIGPYRKGDIAQVTETAGAYYIEQGKAKRF